MFFAIFEWLYIADKMDIIESNNLESHRYFVTGFGLLNTLLQFVSFFFLLDALLRVKRRLKEFENLQMSQFFFWLHLYALGLCAVAVMVYAVAPSIDQKSFN